MDDLISPIRAVCVLDPGIDRAETPVHLYAETRAAGLVVPIPGAHLRWATMRPLTVGDFVAVDSMPTNPAKLLQAFRLSCESVENFSGPGVSLKPTKPHRLPDGRERMIWGDDDLQRLASELGLGFIYELGQVAYERAVAGNGWSGSVSYMLPQSSVHALALIELRLAEQNKANDGTRSSERSAESSTPTPGAS